MRSFYLFLFILLGQFLIAQEQWNLIPNGSFELSKDVPTSFSQSYLLKNWYSCRIDCSAVTYFNTSSFRPQKIVGRDQFPYTGNAFIALGIDLKDKLRNSQYIETPLSAPLMKDSLYQITLYACLGKDFKYSIDHLECSFFQRKFSCDKKVNFDKEEIICLRPDQEFIDNTKNWAKLTGNYKAHGDEAYVVLGNFSFSYKRKKMPFKFKFLHFITEQSTYYFIDEVSMREISKPITSQGNAVISSKNADLPEQLKTNQLARYDIQFIASEAEISSDGKHVLDSAITWMKDKKIVLVDISGFTDRSGAAFFNKALSEKRAHAVYDYFIKANVEAGKIKYLGRGVMNNDLTNDKNVAEDRKAEITIYYQ